MRNNLGIICIILGTALILGALTLFFFNQSEAAEAEKASGEILPQLVSKIEQDRQTDSEEASEVPNTPVELLDPSELVMTEIIIAGYPYIGYLCIPVLDLELPIMSDWSYQRLQISPCRYTGSVKGENFVLLAHNYVTHFGRIKELVEGDSVIFTDMDGEVYQYEVVALDILNPTAVEEMIAGDYDLTLFTCTYGGKERVTVYCDRVKNG